MDAPYEITRHFVQFFSPGTLVTETTVEPINAWDVEAARLRAGSIVERYGARPFAFQFLTRARTAADLDSAIVARSPRYFLAGTVRTLEQVEADDLPNEATLRANMRGNGIARVFRSTGNWAWTGPLNDDDVLLEPETAGQAEAR